MNKVQAEFRSQTIQVVSIAGHPSAASMATVRRSEGSIERKLQNISAVLDVLGAPWINGYKPLAHDQDARTHVPAKWNPVRR
jgi:hypothetical protein